MSAERMRFLEAAIAEAMRMYEDPSDIVRESVKKLDEECLSRTYHVISSWSWFPHSGRRDFCASAD